MVHLLPASLKDPTDRGLLGESKCWGERDHAAKQNVISLLTAA